MTGGSLRRTLGTLDGLAMVVGIMVGSGIFRTPGLVARELGRPWLTFVVWALGGALALLGGLVFAELATRHPKAGGKWVYAREAFGPRAGFVVGWVEGLAIYPAAVAAISVVCGEYVNRLAGWRAAPEQLVGVAIVTLFTAINVAGVAAGRWAQNLATGAKLLALGGVVVAAYAAGAGAGWGSTLAAAPRGAALGAALAVAFQSVIWTYYGYVDAAKIAEEVVDPGRTLPRVFVRGIVLVTALYLLLNAAFLHVLPLDRIAASNLVAGDVADAVFGPHGGAVIAVLALLVLFASINGNVFVTPRVLFGLAREGLAPAALARVNRGGSPWVAVVAVGAVAAALAATGTFEGLLGLIIALILLLDGFTVFTLFRLRARAPDAPFRTPLYPYLPALVLAVYAALLVGTAAAQPGVVLDAVGVLALAYVASLAVRRRA